MEGMKYGYRAGLDDLRAAFRVHTRDVSVTVVHVAPQGRPRTPPALAPLGSRFVDGNILYRLIKNWSGGPTERPLCRAKTKPRGLGSRSIIYRSFVYVIDDEDGFGALPL